jgi:hypothetical protein
VKKLLIAGLTVVALAGLAVGIAWAAWTATGSGSGSASSSNAGLTVSVGSASGLYPGGTVQVPVTFYNSSSSPIGLDADTVTPTFDAEPQGRCGLSGAYVPSWDSDDHAGVSHVAQYDSDAAGYNGDAIGDAIAVSMAGWAPDSCQNENYNVYVSATASQCP